MLKASLANGEKCCKKVYIVAAKACRAFEVDREALQKKQDSCVNALKAPEEEMDDARQNNQESLQRIVEVVRRFQDEMLEQTRFFCPGFVITADKLDPLEDSFEKDI